MLFFQRFEKIPDFLLVSLSKQVKACEKHPYNAYEDGGYFIISHVEKIAIHDIADKHQKTQVREVETGLISYNSACYALIWRITLNPPGEMGNIVVRFLDRSFPLYDEASPLRSDDNPCRQETLAGGESFYFFQERAFLWCILGSSGLWCRGQ